MIITKDIFLRIPMRGEVTLEVFHPEDVQRMESLHSEHGENTLSAGLINAVAAQMRSSSGASAYHITTSSSWFTRDYPGEVAYQSQVGLYNNAWTQQDGNDGIFGNVNADTAKSDGTSNGTGTLALLLSTIAGNSSSGRDELVCTWTSESRWLGYFDGNAGGTTTSLVSASTATGTTWKLGNSFSVASGNSSSFATEFATYTASSFTLDAGDTIKAVWTITIG